MPGQLSITGLDDIDLAAATEPALTTVSVPITEMAAAAASEIVRQLAGYPAAPSLALPCELVIRKSCEAPARPPARPRPIERSIADHK